jgi:hypothetical protein
LTPVVHPDTIIRLRDEARIRSIGQERSIDELGEMKVLAPQLLCEDQTNKKEDPFKGPV